MKAAASFFLALGLLPTPARAEGQAVEEGDRVRVTTSEGETWTGRVKELASDSVVVELEGNGISRATPLADVRSLETRGRRSRAQGAWAKAKWGALIGAVPGAISLGIQHEEVGEAARASEVPLSSAPGREGSSGASSALPSVP